MIDASNRVVEYRDGKVYAGATPADVVARIKNDGIFTCGETNAEYMKGVAQRSLRYDGITIRANDEGAFLEDLAANGVIKIRSMS